MTGRGIAPVATTLDARWRGAALVGLVLALCAALSGHDAPLAASSTTDRTPARRSRPRPLDEASAPAALVNVFIGTGGHGHTHPAATRPFGMVQVGPDTRLGGWDGSSGYHYSDSRIFGFTHTHLSGTGIPDYGDVLLMPLSGEVRTENGADGRPGYASAFSHEHETASPGYYAVTLEDAGVRAEMTATTRTGLHRYTFPPDRDAHLIVDLEHLDTVVESYLRLSGQRDAVGLRRSTGWAKDQRAYFALRFSEPYTSVRLLVDGQDVSGREARGTRVKAVFSFGRPQAPLLVRVALSGVDTEGAARNLEAEHDGWDFEGARAAAHDAWERELSKITVRGGTLAQRRIFYTALYHSVLAPNVFMDADGRYRGLDRRVHRADGFTYYSVFSLWDTYRALHPLLTIVDRARTTDFIRTFLRHYTEGGRLPVWELAGNETDTMIGYHAVPVIADAWLKGIDGFDRDLAWRAMTGSADADRFGLAAYKRHGYIPADAEAESVSKTLEYAYDDWTIAMVARATGRTAAYERFLRRSQAWKHVFDPATGFMRAREDGFWVTPFDPVEVNVHYTEANAWQYSFAVPHDIDGLIRAHGGPWTFARRLDALFSADSRTTGRDQPDITGTIGQYAHGNEPSHHVAYLYANAGQPWKTQTMVRRIVDTLYADAPDGLPGNEDCGQMSAWLVFSALGFYPVAPGSGEYVIGTPLFEEATMRLENGRTFTVRAPGVTPEAIYVQRATLDGKPWTRSALPHAAVAAGGELVLHMGPTPNESWGSARSDVPRSAVTEHLVTPIPHATEGQAVFRGTQTIALRHVDPNARIRYTTDGSVPGPDARLFSSPLTARGTLSLNAVASVDGRDSPAATFRAHRVPDNMRVRVSVPWAPQYSAGGADALIDGLRGGADFRLGRWQGYQAPGVEATVDLGEMRDVRRVTVGFLQEIRAWVLMPRTIRVAVSDDGARWVEAGTAESDVSPHLGGALRRDIVVTMPTRRARFVRVTIDGGGPLPATHASAGEMSWIFADEIVVE